jgi:NADP-dependent 3-hydroxy acid dehydrogenase YdfG
MSSGKKLAVVTGASSGMGAATAKRLAAEGFHVLAGARRVDRLQALANGTISVAELDVTDDDSVAAFVESARELGLPISVLVNNAGVAVGADTVADSSPEEWRHMYDVNVLGVLRMTQRFLPHLEAAGGGHVVIIGSTVGHVAYETGAGYAASKHAVSAVASTLRLELNGTSTRVTEIAPGMVKTEEFLMHRFRGDEDRYAKVYEGVAAPLTAEDIADCVAWCVTRPAHVDIDLLFVRPVAQAAQHKVHRET